MSSEMRELIAKWRHSANEPADGSLKTDYDFALEDCANDLEALLARTEAGAVSVCSAHREPVHGCSACNVTFTRPQEASGDAEVAWSVLHIGNDGAAYDPPNTRRAFTYEKQPGNIDASRLGRAADAAAIASAGDSIDRGLALLKELQALGFGVFHIGPAAMQAKEAK